MKKQLIIFGFLIAELIVAYAITNNILNLPNEYLIIVAPVIIQLVKSTVKKLKENNEKM